jgi:acid phosphatase (class A)
MRNKLSPCRKALLILLLLSFFLPLQAACARGLMQPGPSALLFLPPPPAENSPDFIRDISIYVQNRSFCERAREQADAKALARVEQAALDADSNNWPESFKEELGFVISKGKTPATWELFHALLAELSRSYRTAKAHYQRVRPFAYFNDAGKTCTPAYEKDLKANGSYPSGHATKGWGMALVLAELLPERQNAILKRGYEYGQSRVVCGVHWQSDVDAGRMVGAAVAAQLHNSPELHELFVKAEKELEALLRKPADF